MRDLEGALEVEKSEVKEVKYNLDMLTKQHRFVQRFRLNKNKYDFTLCYV